MLIQFLGNGGFIGNGLPYNSFLIDGNFLMECPPDIMPSMRRQGIRPSQIKKIFLSHFHGDHYFGMPFFTLNLILLYSEQTEKAAMIDVLGPEGLRDHIINLQKIAVSPDNPSVSGIDEIYRFIEITLSSHLRMNNKDEMIFHRMNHPKETYGFSIIRNGAYYLTYLPDTIWDDSFIKILSSKPKYVICDLNGDSSDRMRVHMAEQDIVEKAIPVTGDATVYIGTHLRDNCTASQGGIIYATAGTTIEIS